MPLVTLLLIAYNQERVIRDAVRGALAQTYSPLEIIISDDGSTDATYSTIKQEVAEYDGPHRVIMNRNATNLGISGHLGSLWPRVSGELVVIAAGDDISVPERCARVVECWLARNRVPDLIATDLMALNATGESGARIRVDDLEACSDVEAWFAHPPRVVGAAHAWTRRLMQRFPPIPPGSWEDRLMVFRALLLGGAVTLHEPLVQYRKGGQSQPGRAYTAATVARRLRANSARALVEIPQMIRDAQSVGSGAEVARLCSAKLSREVYIHRMLSAQGHGQRLRHLFARFSASVPVSLRLRTYVYAACPGLLAPLFLIKRLSARRSRV